MSNYMALVARVSTISGNSVKLRSMDQIAASALYEAVHESDRELQRYMPWGRSRSDVEAFVTRATVEQKSGSSLQLAVLRTDDERIAGVVGLKNIDPFTPRAELGYWIRTSLSGKGMATDAACTLTKYALRELGLQRLDACVATTNQASERVLRKAGYLEEGRKPRAEFCHGVWHDHILFGRIQGD